MFPFLLQILLYSEITYCFVPTHEPAVSESFDIILLFTPGVIV